MFRNPGPAQKAWKWRGYAAPYDLVVNRLVLLLQRREAFAD